MFLGNEVLPQAAIATSNIKQKWGMINGKYIVEKHDEKRSLRLKPIIRFTKQKSVCEVILFTLSEASQGAGIEKYAQNAILCRLMAEDMQEHKLHPV